MDKITNLSPLDGRYADDLEPLRPYFSEWALIRYRVRVEIEYLIALSEEPDFPDLTPFSPEIKRTLREQCVALTPEEAGKVKAIEARIGHDVKAVEYYLREKCAKRQLGHLKQWIHFGLTSEDVNNIAYTLMWQEALQDVYRPMLKRLGATLRQVSKQYRAQPLLARTHGQPATPTTLGKEMAVFYQRLQRQADLLQNHTFQGKLGGATGTWSAHNIAYPKVDWLSFAARFIESCGLQPNLITTQVEPCDSLVESYQALVRINSILLDFCHDMWSYISRGIFIQRRIQEEVGSSTMPHKVNPIHFENGEGNLGLSNALLNHLITKLPRSRLQRDLSGSTVLRNQGVALGYSYLALKNILRGLQRVAANPDVLHTELDAHWEVLAEAVQTLLRKAGNPKAYETLKELTRGEKLSRETMRSLIEGLDLPEEDRDRLLQLSPQQYTGLAEKLVDLL